MATRKAKATAPDPIGISTITLAAWNRTPSDYRQGDPNTSTAQVKMWQNGADVWIPVYVVDDPRAV